MVQQLLILGVLHEGKMHGYKLNEYVSHAMGMYTDVKKSTLYYTMEKLEAGGYITKELEREGKRPERRVYEITETGRAYFLELLREHLRSYNRAYFADDIAIMFMNRLSTDEVRLLLEEKRNEIQGILQQFQNHPDLGGYQQYVISHNIAHLEADIRWIDEVSRELK
jgi:DNA-binding PadR family transcriptional regulator